MFGRSDSSLIAFMQLYHNSIFEALRPEHFTSGKGESYAKWITSNLGKGKSRKYIIQEISFQFAGQFCG